MGTSKEVRMKLIDLMVSMGTEWPVDYCCAEYAAQDSDGRVWFYGKMPKCMPFGIWDSSGHISNASEVIGLPLAEDWNSCVVTKAQYDTVVRLHNKAKAEESMIAPTQPEHPDVTAFKKWYAETLPVVEAQAAGATIEQLSGHVWVHKDNDIYNTLGKYRIKPNTININGYEVPEPLRVAPTDDAYVYGVSSAGGFSKVRWNDSKVCRMLLVRGMLHTTKEAAEIHSKALASFTKLGV